MLAGFGARKGPVHEVHDDLEVHAVVLRSGSRTLRKGRASPSYRAAIPASSPWRPRSAKPSKPARLPGALSM